MLEGYAGQASLHPPHQFPAVCINCPQIRHTQCDFNDNSVSLPWGRIGGQDNADPIVAAVGAITLAYVRNRICAPRDMSAGAATAFRAAADKVLASLY